jgi:penicillin-binding protein 1A
MQKNIFAAMDPSKWEVKAWVGGIDFRWFKYDHVMGKVAYRQSNFFKPLFTRLAVTELGYTPETLYLLRSF